MVDEDENDLNITPLSILDGVQYFGQKDLSNSADHENGLLEKLVSGKIGQQATVDNCVVELCDAVSQLLDVNKIPRQIEEANTQKSEIEHKISIFEEKGVAEKLKKQAVYTTDQTKLDSAKTKVTSIIKVIKRTYETHNEASSSLSEHESSYNSELITAAKKVLALIDQQLMAIGNAIKQMQIQERSFEDIIEKLGLEVTALADEFAEIKREIKDETLDADTFVQLTAEMEKAKERLRQLREKSKTKAVIEKVYKKAECQRNDSLLQLFQAYQLETERINQIQSEIRIAITFKGDKEGFKARLKGDFRGTGISETKYQILSDTFADYVALVEDWILADGKTLRSILTASEYGRLEEKLREQYAELLAYQVKQHSIGQRASALILFILTQDNNDVIFIDQPEDDLDNKVIYDEVISAIVKKKTNIQFVFATHNANIPVLGDAERILVVDYQDTKIDVSQGNIDLGSTHEQIVDIMEGGKEAFARRQLIYESWR